MLTLRAEHTAWGLTPVLPFLTFEILSKLLNYSESQFFHLKKNGNINYP